MIYTTPVVCGEHDDDDGCKSSRLKHKRHKQTHESFTLNTIIPPQTQSQIGSIIKQKKKNETNRF